MLLDTDFTFVTFTGEHRYTTWREHLRIPHYSKDPDFENIIVCDPTTLISKQLYPLGSNPSIAMEFANLDINNDNRILQFHNKYGFLYSSLDNNISLLPSYARGPRKINDYIPDSDIEHHSFFQHAVVEMRQLLLLKHAIESDDIVSMVSLIVFFLFNKALFYHPNSLIVSFISNYHRDYLDYENKISAEEHLAVDTIINMFLSDINSQIDRQSRVYKALSTSQKTFYENRMLFIQMVKTIKANHQITALSPLGEMTFFPSLSRERILSIFPNTTQIRSFAENLFSDIIGIRLQNVRPEVRFDNDKCVPRWRIRSLLEAMYLEIFFNLHNQLKIKKCANCNCTKYFIADNPRRLYCSEVCSWAANKRKIRTAQKQFGG